MTVCVAQDLNRLRPQNNCKIVLSLVDNLNVQNMVASKWKHMYAPAAGMCVVLSSFSDATCIISAAKASDKCSDNPGCIETTEEVGCLS